MTIISEIKASQYHYLGDNSESGPLYPSVRTISVSKIRERQVCYLRDMGQPGLYPSDIIPQIPSR